MAQEMHKKRKRWHDLHLPVFVRFPSLHNPLVHQLKRWHTGLFIYFHFHHPALAYLFPSCTDVERVLSVNWVKLKFRSCKHMEIHVMYDVCSLSIGIKREHVIQWITVLKGCFLSLYCALFLSCSLYLPFFSIYCLSMHFDAAVTTSLHRQIDKWQRLSEPC